MSEIMLLKHGEMVLKGLNRRGFEEKLMGNAKRRLKKHGSFKIYTRQSTTYVEPLNDDCDFEGAWEAMGKLFGVVGLSRAKSCPKDADAIVACAKEYLADKLRAARSFKVESKRADKTFPMTSIQLSQYVGGELHDAFPHLIVDVHQPELTVHVEVRDYAAFVHADPEEGAGGLPVGMGGRALSLLSGGIDSPVASWMIAKRGIIVDMIHFYSYPYTSPEAKDKVLELARLLTPYTGKTCVYVVPFTKIQEELRRSCPEDLFTLLMRRFMMRIACRVAEKNEYQALVTGESVGQVASQTLEAMTCTNAVCTAPVLRPVVGMDKEEIVRISRKIGTYDTSILPYEDCCTVFTPKHPKTRPHLDELVEAEKALDVEGMVSEAVEGIERVMVEG
jgi:thiamine biosynthesis protein ThiI